MTHDSSKDAGRAAIGDKSENVGSPHSDGLLEDAHGAEGADGRGGEEELRLGGMALHNGLLLHSSNHWAAAIRDDGGSIEVASGRKRVPLGGKAGSRVPLVRGVLRLADAMVLLPDVKRALGRSVLPFEGSRVALTIGATTLATAGLKRREGGSILRQEALAALLALVPAAVALKNTPLAAYHGAEHKSIGEFEAASGRRSRPASKEHERCGSNLIGPLLATNVAGNVLLRSVVRKPSPAVGLATGLVSMGAAMEAFRWMSKHPDATLARLIRAPGQAVQRFLTTDEPSEAQLEVAHRALEEILRLEGRTWPTEASDSPSSS